MEFFWLGLALSSAIRASAQVLRKRRREKFHRTAAAAAVGIFAFQTHPLRSAVKIMSNTAPFSVAWRLPADNRLPRLEMLQRTHPDIDIRIDATDAKVDMETTDVDPTLRYSAPGHVPSHAVRLFGVQLTPVANKKRRAH